MKSISIIIPTFNEELLIEKLCRLLKTCKTKDHRIVDIIVVDAQSTDLTREIALNYDANVVLAESKSRAIQLNTGAQHAKGDILYFIHADVLPPMSFVQDIAKAVSDGVDFGCFSYRFDHDSSLLKINSKFTRKDSSFIGGGDQTLFIKKEVFSTLGGYCNEHLIMEDYDLYWRAKQRYKHRIICNDALVSARKYDDNSYLRVQIANLIIFNGYKLGLRQETLASWYQKLLK